MKGTVSPGFMKNAIDSVLRNLRVDVVQGYHRQYNVHSW